MKLLLQAVVAIVLLAQAGCGGGGGGGGGGSASVNTISGTASKGIIKNGQVKIYAINADGSRGSLLAETTTDSAGKYSKDVGSYSGPVIAYAFGAYTDEATGTTVTLTENNALRAALPALGSTNTLPITALTDLAVRKAGSALTTAAIANANAMVSSALNVDITGFNPVDASASAMADAAVVGQQVDYTLALAAVSQMAKDATGNNEQERLEKALATLADGITASTMSGAAAKTFTDAVNAYLESHVTINTLISNRGGSPVITVGSKKGQIAISLSSARNNVYGASLTLTLPAGVTVNTRSDGTTCNGVIGLTAASAGATTLGSFTPASGSTKATLAVALASSAAFGNGKLLIINANVAPGTKITKESFALSGVSLVDQSGGTPAGSTCEVSDATAD